MATQTYVISLYMNDKFVKEYYEPFLALVENDPSLDIKVIKARKKRGKKSVKLEIESPAIRALIKKYVDLKKKRMLNEVEEPKEDTTTS